MLWRKMCTRTRRVTDKPEAPKNRTTRVFNLFLHRLFTYCFAPPPPPLLFPPLLLPPPPLLLPFPPRPRVRNDHAMLDSVVPPLPTLLRSTEPTRRSKLRPLLSMFVTCLSTLPPRYWWSAPTPPPALSRSRLVARELDDPDRRELDSWLMRSELAASSCSIWY